MNITKNSTTCKSAGTKPVNFIDIGSGNIIPHWWYSNILAIQNKSDIISITPLFKLWALLYRSNPQSNYNLPLVNLVKALSLSQLRVNILGECV